MSVSLPAPQPPAVPVEDIASVSRISAVPTILQLVCDATGMGFSAVARVTDESWTACAVHDRLSFGLAAGGQLDLRTTLCFESRAARQPIVVDDFNEHPIYNGHHTPLIYGLRSYISVPIVLPDGSYFGNLCAIDANPASVANSRTLAMFESFASLIAAQLASDRATQGVRAALSEERETAKLREQFIAVLGHDLRNPLSAISYAAQALIAQKSDPVHVKTGQRIQSAVQRMSRLIEDVMDFARGRLGAGMTVAPRAESDLACALHAVVAELAETRPDRVIVEEIHIDTTVHCDVARLQQLVSNLLGNALAYGDAEAPVVVRAQALEAELVLSVTNGGKPIASEDLERLFEPYWRPAERSAAGGLGLGLYICHEIVRAHGGALEVRSTRECGTCFTARIPLR
ncbi:GAF domain-containing sensor histidine kinase [Cupriavidus plantarum]|uniref:histidine kinase n=1 Tax=Cupriavidus plantarum TaxID=942865 RepID=A0A316FIF8_9BURK|nr:GAF domain-containing sensor histidine kinase [Cupriavidus plantarum]PWK37410.1 GAF domain-containing protein [Cupriavidus plantarum]